MRRILRIAGLAAAGLSLFGLSFIGFSLASGAPRHEIALIGWLFDPPPDPEEGEEPPAPEEAPSDLEVLESRMGALATYSLEPPFTEGELQRMVDEIKGRQLELQRWEEELVEREGRSQERQETVDEQFESLAEMRLRLEEFELELDLREREVERGEAARAEREEAAFLKTAELFKEGDAEELSKRLLEFPSDEAAKILQALGKERARELLAALPDSSWKEYADAYAGR